MPISDHTRREMEAGARHLAQASGTALPPDYMDRIVRTQQRHAQLKAWETARKVEIEYTASLAQDSKGLLNRVYVHVLDAKGNRFAAFDDMLAEKTGGWPSEVLIANIALALQSQGLI